ncbi:MAG: protein kinase [Anaerolineaceae bacterium]|nr:protein kinase [Anaerolineaceae bacterium]
MEIGSVVNGQYTVIEHVGRGGMADVWSARDQRLRRMVAIKTIARNLSPDIDPVALFEREARTIAQMEHPHILPVYDFGEFEGSLYIVMRYMTGGSLEDVLSAGPMDYTEVLQMGGAIAQAMDYAHSNNVIHLDLKPPNILLDSQRMPYLADFGLATALDPEGRARNPGSGTLLYMAPEQLTSETIDRRADIYSFSIMLFHMLTGQLPFDGTAPLAVRQIQYHDEIPDIEEFVPELPPQITEILRAGTLQDPARRPPTFMNIIDQMQDILIGSDGGAIEFEGIPNAENLFQLELPSYDVADSELMEAIDIYSRARHAWAGGQGRFLVSMTHYLLMVQYYMDAEFHDLLVDQSGLEMLLRGALEYDYEVDFWWNKADDKSRRLVSLHTIRSGTTPARIRAFNRLETLPDDEVNPTIPRLVSQALAVERDPLARIAALRLLTTRSQLVKSSQSFQIMTQYRGRMITTMTRMGLLMAPTSVWRDTVYTTEIDQFIADQAMDTDEPAVSEYAARAIGRIRSLAAVQYLAEAQREGRDGALRALGFVRDEAPSLPEGVSAQARFYAWTTNTVRRLSNRPLDLIARFLLVLIAAWIGMGQQVYNTFLTLELFSLQRITNTLGFGMMFGMLAALVVFFSDELSRRLSGFWPWWARLAIFGSVGYFLATVAWYLYQLLFLQYEPPITLAAIAGFGMAFGYIVSALVRLKPWQSVILATIASWLPLYAGYASYYESDWFNVAWGTPVGIALGLVVGVWMYNYRYQNEEKPDRHLTTVSTAFFAIAGAAIAVGIWMIYGSLHDGAVAAAAAGTLGPLSWEGTALLTILPMMLSIVIGYVYPDRRTLAFGGVFLALFTFLYAQYGLTTLANPALAPSSPDTILYFVMGGSFGDHTGMIYTISLPMMFVTALGAYLPFLMRDWWNLVGIPRQFHERSAWLGGVLAYTMAAGVIVSIFALFSIQYDAIWALLWSFWGFLSFIAALAAWRWARWGARAMIVLAVAALIGGFVYDFGLTMDALRAGDLPLLFAENTSPVWMAWALWLAAFTWATWRRRLWGVMGLAVMMILWWGVALFAPIQESYAILGATNLALLAYAIRSEWDSFEVDRFHMPDERKPHLPAKQPASTAGPTEVVSPVHQPQPEPTPVAETDVSPDKTTRAVPMTQQFAPLTDEELAEMGTQRRSPSTKHIESKDPIIDYEGKDIGHMPTEVDVDAELDVVDRAARQTHDVVEDDQLKTEHDPAGVRGADISDKDTSPIPQGTKQILQKAAEAERDEAATNPSVTDRMQYPDIDETALPELDTTDPATDFPVISFDIGSLDDVGMQTRPPGPPDPTRKRPSNPIIEFDLGADETGDEPGEESTKATEPRNAAGRRWTKVDFAPKPKDDTSDEVLDDIEDDLDDTE